MDRILDYANGVASVFLGATNPHDVTEEAIVDLLQNYGVPAGAPVTVQFWMDCPHCDCGQPARITNLSINLVMPAVN